MNEELKKLDEALRPLDYKLFALFLVFLTLKLTGVINWSWWLICLPAYFLDALIVAVVLVMVIIAILLGTYYDITCKVREKKEKLKK